MIQMTFTERHLCNEIAWHCQEHGVWRDILFKLKAQIKKRNGEKKNGSYHNNSHDSMVISLLKRSGETKGQGIKTCVSHYYRNWSANADAK